MNYAVDSKITDSLADRSKQLTRELHQLKDYQSNFTPPYIPIKPTLAAYGLPDDIAEKVKQQNNQFEKRKKTSLIVVNVLSHPLIILFTIVHPSIGFKLSQINDAQPNYSSTAYVIGLILSLLISYVVLLFVGLLLWIAGSSIVNRLLGYATRTSYDPDALEHRDFKVYETYQREHDYYLFWKQLHSEVAWTYMSSETIKESVIDVYHLFGFKEEFDYQRWSDLDFLLVNGEDRILFTSAKYSTAESIDGEYIATLTKEAQRSDATEVRILTFMKPPVTIDANLRTLSKRARMPHMQLDYPSKLINLLTTEKA